MTKKTHGGLRPNSGRPKGTVKGRQLLKQIQVTAQMFEQLEQLKKAKNSKSWTAFFADLIALSEIS